MLKKRKERTENEGQLVRVKIPMTAKVLTYTDRYIVHHHHHHHLFAQNRSWTTRPNMRHLQLPTITGHTC